MNIYIESFNNDERNIINSFVEGEFVGDFTKTDLTEKLIFIKEGCTDADITAMINLLLDKVKAMPETVWNEIRFQLPFETDYDAAECYFD